VNKSGVTLALLAGVAWLLQAEYPDWGRRLARALVRAAAGSLRPAETAARYKREWLNELDAIAEQQDGAKAPTGLVYALGVSARFAVWPSVRSLSTSLDATLIVALGIVSFVDLAAPVLFVTAVVPAAVIRAAGIPIEPWFLWAAEGRPFSRRLARWHVMTVARAFAWFFGAFFLVTAVYAYLNHKVVGTCAGLTLFVHMTGGFRRAASLQPDKMTL
jgi:hypothetical protein